MASGYTIVDFLEGGGGVMAIPVSWLISVNNELKCYWPKKNAATAVEKQASVRGDWSLLSVRRMTKNVYQTYDSPILHKKVELAALTSNVDTDCDSDDGAVLKSKKSKKRHRSTNCKGNYS
jgi:hypothetical protein